jgi:hypothetical protein
MTTKKKTSGPSGKHKNPQRLLSQTTEDFAAQDAHVAERGESWGEWVRAALAETMRRQVTRKKSPE